MATRLRRLPPGRVGLAWLAQRLAVATRAGDLLEHKLRILLAEERNYALAADRTRQEWEEAVGELERWTLRSALLSGERAARLAQAGQDCRTEIEWRITMGVRYPASATCRPGTPHNGDRPFPNSALVRAVPAAQRAARAGVEHAVADRALAAIRQEIAATRRQLRALRERWVPLLQEARRDLLVALDDQEHEEHVRLRWAADTTRGRAGP